MSQIHETIISPTFTLDILVL